MWEDGSDLYASDPLLHALLPHLPDELLRAAGQPHSALPDPDAEEEQEDHDAEEADDECLSAMPRVARHRQCGSLELITDERGISVPAVPRFEYRTAVYR